MVQPPNRKKFITVLLSILALIYALVAWFLVKEIRGESTAELLGLIAFVSCLALLCQWLMVAGDTPELEIPHVGFRIARSILGALALGWIAFLWAYAAFLLKPSMLPSGIDPMVVYLPIGVSGAVAGFFSIWRIQITLGRYKQVLVLTLLIGGAALGYAMAGGVALIESHNIRREMIASDIWNSSDSMAKASLETFAFLSFGTAIVTMIWALAPIVYLIAYARAHREALVARQEE